MKNANFWKTILIGIFLVSLSLRLILCIFNRQANDDHLEVIDRIINKHEIPRNEDCWECFQPKTFYLFNAGIIASFHIESKAGRIISVQLVNLIFSFFILLLIWKFVNKQNYRASIKMAAFALVAFNPCLAAINVQATNDTLEILAGVGTIYFALSFFENKKFSDSTWMIGFAVLAAIVKASGLVIYISLVFIFLFKILFAEKDELKAIRKSFILLALASVLIIPVAGGYFQNEIKYGSPFVNNIQKAGPAVKYRPGITSVKEGYLTFRIADMIKTPYVTNDTSVYVLHRTSLWSQLYGHTVFLHFDQYPPSWRSLDSKILNTGRTLIILGLLPLLLLIAGCWMTLISSIKNLFRKNRSYFAQNKDWIHLVFATSFLLFMVKYSFDYRDYSTMKSIFIFPALPSFIALFMKGISNVKFRAGISIALVLFATIVLLSTYDICFLIYQLWS